MTTVDGGALTCRSKDDCERGRLLRWYGIDRTSNRKDFRCEEDILEYGYKFHMNDVSATIGLSQLQCVAENLSKTQANAAQYDKAFCDLKNILGPNGSAPSWIFHGPNVNLNFPAITIQLKNFMMETIYTN